MYFDKYVIPLYLNIKESVYKRGRGYTFISSPLSQQSKNHAYSSQLVKQEEYRLDYSQQHLHHGEAWLHVQSLLMQEFAIFVPRLVQGALLLLSTALQTFDSGVSIYFERLVKGFQDFEFFRYEHSVGVQQL